MRLAHCCLLGCLVLGGGTAWGGGGRMFFMPEGEDPANSTSGENFVTSGQAGTTITVVAYLEGVIKDLQTYDVAVNCDYPSSAGGGDLHFVAGSVDIDTNRPDYMFAGVANFPALDQGQCEPNLACVTSNDCTGNSMCMDGFCDINVPRAGGVSFAGAVTPNGTVYLAQFDFEIPTDASGEYKLVAACTANDKCPQIFTSVDDGEIPVSFDGLIIQLPGPAPEIVHENGLPGQTRPHSGFIDPRSEATLGGAPDGITTAQIRFNTPVFGSPDGFDLTTFNFFVTQSDGNPAPDVIGLTQLEGGGTLYEIELDRPLSVQTWTTIRVVAFGADGTQIANNGNQGPSVDEVDRVDIGFLPCDVDQGGSCSPLDLFRFRQFVNNPGMEPAQGTRLDILDMDRSGGFSPLDLFRLRQLVNGVAPATMPWSGATLAPRP